MNKEIEIKAWVSEPEMLKNRLVQLYGEPSAIKKDDIYYIYRNMCSERGQPVRLRLESGKNTVTLKKKSICNGIETNDELEFAVDNGENFLKFLQLSGAQEWVTKKKQGWKFTTATDCGEAVIELCKVSSLGWFIEIEIVLEAPDDRHIEDARTQLFAVLHSTGVTEDKIESRYYSEMLLEG